MFPTEFKTARTLGTTLRPTFRTTALLRAVGWGLVPLAVMGCANPGPPRPPSLELPALVRDLGVRRVGDRVKATWTTPSLTSEKTRIHGPITAMLCREAGQVVPGVAVAAGPGSSLPSTAPATHAGACVEAARQVTVPGATVLLAPLAPDLLAGPARLLAYRVELLNAHGRSAGRSNVAWTLAGIAPMAVGRIEVAARPEGALITWQPAAIISQPTGPAGESVRMELLRRTLSAAPAPAAGHPPGFRRSAPPGGRAAAATRSPAPGRSDEVRLAAPQSGASAAGGFGEEGLFDRTVESGATYSYVAQRVRDVTIAGRTLSMVGEASAPVTLTYRDVFPPTPPAGLQAVPGGGFGSAMAGSVDSIDSTGPVGSIGSVVSIDLSWEPSPEADVAGYNIYRSEANAASGFVRLNAEPVTVPAYRDATVVAGKRYRYRVTAVDGHNNESAPGAEVEEQVQR